MSETRVRTLTAQPTAPAFPPSYVDPRTGDVQLCRRTGQERRTNLPRALLHGGVFPRRLAGRRAIDHHRPVVDTHGAALLISCILVLLLSLADALLTLRVIHLGATEANPVMALWVYHDVQTFAIVKMALTGGGLLALVAVARFRVFGVLRASSLVHAVLGGYVALMGYHFWLLERVG